MKTQQEMKVFAERALREVSEKVGTGKALCALSGGVDSSVCAVLMHKAIGERLICVLVDHGLMRKNEADEVERVVRGQYNINLIRVNAQKRFLDKLKGVLDPEQKRKVIGEEFIRVFEEEAKKIGKVDFLVQGTIYPDILESGKDPSTVIKSHHNVGGLPDVVDFKEIIEPVRELYKDEVRMLGLALGMPESLVFRQPFPGPGLGVRVLGEITEEKLSILREADAIFREEVAREGLDRTLNQYFAIITDIRSVGIKDNKRTYDYTIGLRAVKTVNFVTAEAADLPFSLIKRVSSRISAEVAGAGRVVYDVSDKPPATIEWL